MQLPAPVPSEPSSFSYEQLDEQTRVFVQQKAQETHHFLKRTSQLVIQIGLNLLAVKEKLPYGDFTSWVEQEFSMTYRTAYNLMTVAKRFGDEDGIITTLPATILYELAAPSTPSAIIDLIKHHEIPPTMEVIREVKKALLEAKETESQAMREAKEAQTHLRETQQQAEAQQAHIVVLHQEIEALQTAITRLSQPMIQIKEVEKEVLPPETIAQLEDLREQVTQLIQQRDTLQQQQKVIEDECEVLQKNAAAAAWSQREDEEERTIRLKWYRTGCEFRACIRKLFASWPSPLDTTAFLAEDWNRLSEIHLMAQRLINECERLTASHVIESQPP